MTWTIPDQGEGANDLQSEVFQSSLDAVLAGHRRTGVFTGCAVSQRAAGANMSVDVAAGIVMLSGAPAAVAAGNVAVGAADATNPRLDLVVSDGSGTLSVIAGTAAAAPKEATLDTTTYILLAQVYVPATATTITTARITDRRVDVKFPARVVDEVHANAGSASSVAEQTLASLTLPAGVAAAGDVLRFVAIGDYLNNSGGAVTYTWRFKIGATTVLTTIAFSVSSGANRSKWAATVDIAVESTSAQRVGGNLTMGISVAGSNTWQTSVGAGAAGLAAVGYGTAAEDYTAAANHILTCQLGTSNASADVILHAASLALVKK